MVQYESQDIDLSPLLVPDIRFAVRCTTYEEARQFVTAVLAQFPGKDTWLSKDEIRWRNDNEGRHGGRAYFPDLNNVEGEPFVIGDVDFANDNGYTLIYFTELINQVQITESDMPLEFLFRRCEK